MDTRKKWLIIALAAGAFMFVALFGWKSRRPHDLTLARASAEQTIDLLLLNNHCDAAILEADAYLARDPKAEQILLYKGACLMNMERFDEAEEVFSNVLSLDPENEPAKKYLALLSPTQGGVLISEAGFKKMQMDKNEFEGVLGITLDSRLLTFVRAQRQPEAEGFTESLYAVYSFSRNISEVFQHVERELKKLNPISVKKSTPISMLVELSDKETLRVIAYDESKQVVFDYAKLP